MLRKYKKVFSNKCSQQRRIDIHGRRSHQAVEVHMRVGTEGRAGPVPESDEFRRRAVQTVLCRVHVVLRHDCPHRIVSCLVCHVTLTSVFESHRKCVCC